MYRKNSYNYTKSSILIEMAFKIWMTQEIKSYVNWQIILYADNTRNNMNVVYIP